MVDMKVINSYFCLNRGAERKYTHLHVFFFTWKAAALAHTHIHKISTLYFPFFFFFFLFYQNMKLSSSKIHFVEIIQSFQAMAMKITIS